MNIYFTNPHSHAKFREKLIPACSSRDSTMARSVLAYFDASAPLGKVFKLGNLSMSTEKRVVWNAISRIFEDVTLEDFDDAAVLDHRARAWISLHGGQYEIDRHLIEVDEISFTVEFMRLTEDEEVMRRLGS